MLTIKKLVAPSWVWMLTCLTLILFNGCTDPGPRALLEGERLLREGKSPEAIRKLEQASNLLPKDARAWIASNDMPNIERVLARRREADLVIG